MASFPRIAGITVSYINQLIYEITRRNGDIFSVVRESAINFLENTTTEANMRIVNNRGSVFQAIRIYNESNDDLNLNDELIFSRQIALSYVIDYINYRVEALLSRPAPIAAAVDNITEQMSRNSISRDAEIRRNNIASGARYVSIELIGSNAVDPELTCSICLCECQEDMSIGWAKTPCGHYFHYNCLNRITDTRCPNCRAVFINI
jgi:hypothetical protein